MQDRKQGDIFGIRAGIKSMIDIYINNSRQTGRTTFMINGLQDGDLIIVASAQEGRLIEKQLLSLENRGKRGIRVTIKAIPPGAFHEVEFNPYRKGRLIFDHRWVELTYLQAIEEVGYKIAQIQHHASGPSSKPMNAMEAAALKIDGKYKGTWL